MFAREKTAKAESATFTCGCCQREYVKANSDADRDRDYEENYPGVKEKVRVVVCDVCYQQITKRYFQ